MSTIDNFLSAHANSIAVRSQRAELLASNLANADTPGYRPKDIDFASVLQQVGTSEPTAMKATHRSHIAPSNPTYDKNTYFRDSTDISLDENSVDTDFERSEFAANAVHYQASVQFLNSRISGLIRTIRGE